jgi:dTDP-4-dehydrorhamnose reductase
MRSLILGGLGMLGHKVAQQFQKSGETWATTRSSDDILFANEHLPGVQVFPGVDALDLDSIHAAIYEIEPTVIVNCIGIIKQDSLAYDPITSIKVNALLPHQIANICNNRGAKFIHVSTDCVFSGNKGNYSEDDFPDANDLYGRTKLLGETHGSNALTIRTSIIGPELRSCRSLLDWFLSQSGSTSGYTKAIFSGLTTLELSRVIERCATDWSHLSGLYQVSADPISKYDLLCEIKSKYNLDISIEAVDHPVIDRSLDSTRFREATGYQPPSWNEMVSELAALPQPALIGGNHVSAR